MSETKFVPGGIATTSSGSVPVIVALLVAVVFLALSAYLIQKFADWNQVVVVYNAICSVAFSAFGVLLGAKVQEVNVTRAVQTAETALKDAQQKTEAIRTAAKALQVDDEEAGGGGGGKRARPGRQAALQILIDALD